MLRLRVSNGSWREAALATFVGAFILAGLWAGASSPRGAGQPLTDELTARGRVIFQRERCFFCHTLNGKDEVRRLALSGAEGMKDDASSFFFSHSSFVTRSGPDLGPAPRRTDDWHLAHLIDPQAVVASSIMPSYASLPEADLRALIAFVQSSSAIPLTPGPAESIPSMPEDLASYRAGQRLYETYCAGCHGEFGNGIGRVGHLLQPEPRDFTNRAWMAKRTDEYLYRVIADGLPDTAMPGYRDALSPTDRALLLHYLRYFAEPVAKQTLEQGLMPP